MIFKAFFAQKKSDKTVKKTFFSINTHKMFKLLLN